MYDSRMHRLACGLSIVMLGLGLAGGCSVSQTSQTTTPLVHVPDGSEIDLEVETHSGDSPGPGRGPLAIWKRPDGERKVLVTLIPAPGSPVTMLKIDNSNPMFSPDNRRAWLVRDDQTVASFDWTSGVAILGPAGQPEWARPTAPAAAAQPQSPQ